MHYPVAAAVARNDVTAPVAGTVDIRDIGEALVPQKPLDLTDELSGTTVSDQNWVEESWHGSIRVDEFALNQAATDPAARQLLGI